MLSPALIRTGRGVLVVLIALGVISAVLTALSANKVSTAEKVGATVIMARNVRWDLEQVTGQAKRPLKIVVSNGSLELHTFTIEDLNIDVSLTPLSEHSVEVDAPAGSYGFISDHRP